MNWKEFFAENILKGSEQYIKKDAVCNVVDTGKEIKGVVKGIEDFNVEIVYDNDRIEELQCSCPFSKAGNNCKHMAAVLLAWENTEFSSVKEDYISSNARQEETTVVNEAVDEIKPEIESEDSEIEESINEDNDTEYIENISSQSSSNDEVTVEVITDIPAQVFNWPYEVCHDGKIEISADISTEFTYSLYQNKVPLIRSFSVRNVSEEEYLNLNIHIYSDDSLIEHYQIAIEELAPGEEKTFRRPELSVQGGFLASLTERIICNLFVCVTNDKDEFARYGQEISVYAFNQWPGLKYDPDLIAAYITPNHPAVINLVHSAAEYLGAKTGTPSLDAYQTENPDRVLAMANAAYAAIQKVNIIYAEPPANFAVSGQRIRLADEIMSTNMGTCLDISLLYAAVLEAMGLRPILVWVEGHIFSGVWLVESFFPEPYFTDYAQLEKKISLGEIVPVECTMMCAGKSISFDEAVKDANNTISKHEEFQGVSDIYRTRLSEVSSLPSKILVNGQYVLEHHERKDKDVTGLTDSKTRQFDFSNIKEENVTKQTQWERKLLDLSTRNSLINMRASSVIPMLASNLSDLEDALAENIEYEIYPRPKEWNIHKIDNATFDDLNNLGPYAELIEQEAKKRRLHSWLGENVDKELTKLFRSAKKSMEENGASTLYLTLGLLRWVDSSKSKMREYYAPVVLIPIDIISKSARKGYVIRERDDEIQINVTILEYLKQNYNLNIAGLNPIPRDDHGVDIDQIFAIIRQQIMHKKGWDIIENANIGNFSFTQFVMWNDLKMHPDLLERNKVVRGLINGVEEWDQYVEKGNENPYLPVSVDESQLRAINMAASDVSFVLHGPPGTGKSQTITAMIANALAKGKTVLFVAEKMAALEVVQRRLESLGIGDFCLELHSHTAVKKTVLEKLKKVIDIGVTEMDTDYDEKLAELAIIRKSLDSYAGALHARREFGLSVREMIDEYESIDEQSVYIHPDKDFLTKITTKELEKKCILLERLVAAGEIIGHPHNHIFSNIQRTEYTKSLRVDLEDILSKYENALETLCAFAKRYAEEINVKEAVSKNDWINLVELTEAIVKYSEMPEWLHNRNSIEKAEELLLGYVAQRDNYYANKEAFFKSFNENILDIDLNIFVTKYSEAEKKIFGKTKAIENVSNELQNYTKFKVMPEHLSKMSSDVAKFRKIMEDYEASVQNMPQHLKIYASDDLTSQIVSELKYRWIEQSTINDSFLQIINSLKVNGKYETALASSKEFGSVKASFDACEDSLNNLLSMTVFGDAEDWVGSRSKLISELRDNYSELRDWINYQEIKEECINNDMSDICKLYSDGLEHGAVIPVYKKSIYKALIWDIISKESSLNKFTGNSFNESIREYKKMDDEFTEITKKEIYYKLTHNIPVRYEDAQAIKEMSILRKAITSGGRGLSIRSLFDQIPHVLTRLCPCLLMSPISVSQYLSADNVPFDVVIFDEASQLPTCKAVGVLARGNNAVIVGDPNQMPPTSFFAGNMVDEDNLDIEDLDSILDDCLALGMPSTHLQWHYRSRHESLISFSNQEYYENSMLTFPSVNDREKRVKLCTINGTFNRKKGRVNEEEANAIVREVIRRYKDSELNKYSLGIVTFNEKQQSLILDLLQDEYKKDPELEKWADIDRSQEDKLFVKNLENVQGDERDVILFSVTYGPDEDGKLSFNFGPLNREGGWKRLNVAVSRSRMEMIIFSSMTPDMIDLNRTKSKGVEGLKDFLEFAQKGKLIGSSYGGITKTKGISKQLCDAITKEGYVVQKNVGHSDFKVDIAVVNPYDENEYLLGIMLDGDTYNRSNNTKDRELSQIGVLGGLGWYLYRVWTMDWWDNKEQEIKKVLSLIEERKEIAKTEADNPKKKDVGPESEEIIPPSEREKKVSEKKERKKKVLSGNSSFDDADRFKARPVIHVIENLIYSIEAGDAYKSYFGEFVLKSKSAYLEEYYFYLGKTGEIDHDDYILLISKEAADAIKEGLPDEGRQYYKSLLPNVNSNDLDYALDMLSKDNSSLKQFKEIVDIMPRNSIF